MDNLPPADFKIVASGVNDIIENPTVKDKIKAIAHFHWMVQAAKDR